MNARASWLTRVDEGSPSFEERLAELARRGEADLDRIEPAVRAIVSDVRREGDAAVVRFVERFEGRRPERLLLRDYGGKEALASLPAEVREALELSATRIRSYHERQRDHLGGFEATASGITLESRATPLERVGVYAPGGKAQYPSSVLMCALPARVAGVSEIVV